MVGGVRSRVINFEVSRIQCTYPLTRLPAYPLTRLPAYLPPFPLLPPSLTLKPMAEVIPIGSDHAGFQLKERLVEELRALGDGSPDFGPHTPGAPGHPG